MIKQVEILGAHAFFFRSGAAFTLPAPGTVGRAAKPGATDPVWLDLGIVDVGISKAADKKEVWEASPGVKQLKTIVRTKRKITYKIKRTELDNLAIELMWGTGVLPDSPTAAGQFNPLEMDAEGVQGWLKIQYYGRAGTALVTVDHFVDMDTEDDFTPGDDPVEHGLVATGLFSTLNTGNGL